MSLGGEDATMDGQRLGRSLRALRRRRQLRQLDLAEAVNVGQATISRLERGHIDRMPVATIDAVCKALDARLDMTVLWRGAGLDRLLDERHAALTGIAAARLRAAGWQVELEVSYARYGEHGSIDLLALRPEQGVILVVEIKSELASIEETLRRLDAKVRLAAAIILERFGWRPTVIGRILVLADTTTNRSRVARHAALLASALPLRGPEVRDVVRTGAGERLAIGRAAGERLAMGSGAGERLALRPTAGGRASPGRHPAGLWFLPLSHPVTGRRDGRGPDQIRRSRRSPA
ncbi:MAG: helix-turn-helix domain-containing protein [Candidatus Limnocylindrales bacterium]